MVLLRTGAATGALLLRILIAMGVGGALVLGNTECVDKPAMDGVHNRAAKTLSDNVYANHAMPSLA